MHIIDSHVHIFQPRIALTAVMATNNFYEGSCNAEIPVPVPLGHLPGTVEDLLPRMKKDGVERAVVFSTATAPHQVEIINRLSAIPAGKTRSSSAWAPCTPTTPTLRAR